MSREVHIFAPGSGLAFAATHERLEKLRPLDGVRLIVNMRKVDHVNSAWLGFLIRGARLLGGQGGELVVSEPGRFMLKSREALGLEDIFKTFGSDSEALDYFGGDDGAAGVTARLIPIQPAGSAEAEPPEHDAG